MSTALTSSEVRIALHYNVYCQATRYLEIEKVIIAKGNSLQKYDLQSGIWVGMGGCGAGLRMLF